MKTIFYLHEWQLDKTIPNSKRFAEVKIDIKYPDDKQLIDYKPKERVKRINEDFKQNLQRLLDLNLFEQYEVVGTKKSRPRGVKAKVKYTVLNKLNKLDFVRSLWVESVEYATHIKPKEVEKEKYFCVKMTVVIEVEGASPKKQGIETRFVVIKAKSFDDAYEKMEKQRDDYTSTYLNPYGRFVRWRIDSFDDCYETDIERPKDLDKPEGVEVFSKLKSRKLKTKTGWDGKF